MNKLKAFAVIAACTFAVSSGFAEGGACCAHASGAKMTKEACSATFANLNLNETQKAKMEKLAVECTKGGCNEATMAQMEKEAREILNKEQFAAWKAACSGKKADKSQS